jgi:hypothetical protein
VIPRRRAPGHVEDHAPDPPQLIVYPRGPDKGLDRLEIVDGGFVLTLEREGDPTSARASGVLREGGAPLRHAAEP